MSLRPRPSLIAALVLSLAAVGCGSAGNGISGGKIVAVGAENEYANVISQIGGKYVTRRRDR